MFCTVVRPLRIKFPGALYHVTTRSNTRQDIFLDDECLCIRLQAPKYVVIYRTKEG